ncbi:MAG: hypothetical protein COA45_09520 [Zetaproteobacteria bacterium]|nr:MAG: hypothetical protein COA45_09520 [Zetaproteobacteria bacterium]
MRDTKQEVLKFWFEEILPQQWFQKNESFDSDIKERFMVTYDMARKGLCADWARDAEGVLALCLVLDQFPRNMFRDTAKAFKTDDKILLIVKGALHKGFDQLLSPVKRRFIYIPFMHSENVIEQRRCVSLFEAMKEDDPLSYDYALKHLEVIEKFGRFAHRNKILGRESSEEELEYLNLPGAGF